MKKPNNDKVQITRISTGIPSLDSALKGGIPIYSACVISGAPGAGKTILTQQMLFSNASPDSKSLYLTTVSEPAAKVVRYQQQFSFFDPDKVGDEFIYMDLGEIIREQGTEKSLEVLTKIMQDYSPSLIAIDSFRALHDLITDRETFRSFVFELAVKLSSWSTTAFLVGEYTKEDLSVYPEFAIADTIIDLTVEPGFGASKRYLEILKLRGSDFISGKHLYKINSDGIRLFPRVFATVAEGIKLGPKKISSGIPELDTLLEGGFPDHAVVSISGSAGTGKTLLGLQYICEGALKEEQPGVFFSFEESEEQIKALAKSFGWPVDELIEKDLLRIFYREPIDISPEERLLDISEQILGIRAKRVVIDSLTPLFSTTPEENVRQLIFQMSLLLKSAGATSLIVTDVPVGRETISRFGPEESVFDGIIILRNRLQDGNRERFLEVYKMRGARHVSGEHRFKISDSGITVFPKPGEGERID